MLQAFKGPALKPKAFRELYRRIFDIRFSYPEVGVLMSIFDEHGVGSIDGPKFLNSFYRLSRYEEGVMMGTSDPPTLAFLSAQGASDMATTDLINSKKNNNSKGFGSATMIKANKRAIKKIAAATTGSNSNKNPQSGNNNNSLTGDFNKATVNAAWILPHVAGSTSGASPPPALDPSNLQSVVSTDDLFRSSANDEAYIMPKQQTRAEKRRERPVLVQSASHDKMKSNSGKRKNKKNSKKDQETSASLSFIFPALLGV